MAKAPKAPQEPNQQPPQATQPAVQTQASEQPATVAATDGTTAPGEGGGGKKVNDAPINFVEPISADKLVAVVGDTPEAAVPLLTAEQMAALRQEAERDNAKHDFYKKVMDARAPKDNGPAAPPPLAPRMAAQTNAEIEAGRKMNDYHAKLAARRPAPVPEQSNAVFRPADYVPDQKKGQGYVQARNL